MTCSLSVRAVTRKRAEASVDGMALMFNTVTACAEDSERLITEEEGKEDEWLTEIVVGPKSDSSNVGTVQSLYI